jgi:hypothetical protein
MRKQRSKTLKAQQLEKMDQANEFDVAVAKSKELCFREQIFKAYD